MKKLLFLSLFLMMPGLVSANKHEFNECPDSTGELFRFGLEKPQIKPVDLLDICFCEFCEEGGSRHVKRDSFVNLADAEAGSLSKDDESAAQASAEWCDVSREEQAELKARVAAGRAAMLATRAEDLSWGATREERLAALEREATKQEAMEVNLSATLGSQALQDEVRAYRRERFRGRSVTSGDSRLSRSEDPAALLVGRVLF